MRTLPPKFADLDDTKKYIFHMHYKALIIMTAFIAVVLFCQFVTDNALCSQRELEIISPCILKRGLGDP